MCGIEIVVFGHASSLCMITATAKDTEMLTAIHHDHTTGPLKRNPLSMCAASPDLNPLETTLFLGPIFWGGGGGLVLLDRLPTHIVFAALNLRLRTQVADTRAPFAALSPTNNYLRTPFFRSQEKVGAGMTTGQHTHLNNTEGRTPWGTARHGAPQ